MSDELQTNDNDTRKLCRYGIKCYQRNPEHHAKFKHPSQIIKNVGENRKERRYKPYSTESSHTPRSTNDVVHTEARTSQNNTSEEGFSKYFQSEKENPQPKHEEKIDTKVSHSIPEKLSYFEKDTNTNILEELFLVKMPEDFYKFYECLNDGDSSIEKSLATVNLELIGPYELLLGKLPKFKNKELYLTHWRFFYDPPEFQAVLKKKGNSQLHFGYFRDEPNSKPVFMAKNDSSKDYHITPVAENIFGTVYLHLKNDKSPFTAMASQKLMNKIKKYADEHNISIEGYSFKKRLSIIVTKGFHGAGIVVPYDKKSLLGYRPLVKTNANLKKLFENLESATTEDEKDKLLSDLQPVITYASIAVDECDFGTGLEVGIALFCSGLKTLEPSTLSSLCAAYSLLKRESFSKIIQAHIKYRRKGPNTSAITLCENHVNE